MLDMMESHVRAVEKGAELVTALLGDAPDCAVLLGSGLNGVTRGCKIHKRLDYADIPGAVAPGVQSHNGQLMSASLDRKPFWLLNGRVHLYEGVSPLESVFLVRVLARAGIKRLFITNAAGGLDPSHEVGDLMLVTDHINFMGVNPLEGPNHDPWGPRFPDMSDPYDRGERRRLVGAAAHAHIVLHEGVYVGVKGPNLETRAEYRMLRTLGADAVGMSTVPETLAAVHMDLKVAAVSVITDVCDPDDLHPVSIEAILAAAAAATVPLSILIDAFLRGESR